MTWIKTIPYENADLNLKKIYDRVSGPDNNVDNILLVHSLRPHTLTGHMTLYKSVLHHTSNQLPKWYLEAIGTFVSMLNNCVYCVEHHFTGLARLVNDSGKSEAIYAALKSNKPDLFFDGAHLAGLLYAMILTNTPDRVTAEHIAQLKNSGLSDGEILEINQVVAYFNYANRTVLGLGVTVEGDLLGLSPGNSSDTDNWKHT